MNEQFMRRALQLARGGEGRVAPNPMVGAVVVTGDRIIGEGFHAAYGGPHAEVNAIASVRDEDLPLLSESTIYVTLEPCSHYGKTPPCAKLIIERGISDVVVGAHDPNPLVAGQGVKMLRDAGVNVTEGVMEEECVEINRRFMTAHTQHRPWIQLKWAQSSDGFMAGIDSDGVSFPVKFSNAVSAVWMHRERANAEAIMVGRNTDRIDHPGLDVRLWGGRNPERIVCPHDADLRKIVNSLSGRGVTSLMVEGGARLLDSFIRQGLYDEIRVEVSPIILGGGLAAPKVPQGMRQGLPEYCRGNEIRKYRRVLSGN